MADVNQTIVFTLNGQKVEITVNPLKRLLDVLREDFGMTGAKEGCSEGECGACSVLLNGNLVTSCLIPIGSVAGQKVETIEKIKKTSLGKSIVKAFATEGAVQCGFCIPGMVMASYYLLKNNPAPTEAEIREGISGNVCRCTGYDLIVRAVQVASGQREATCTK